MFIIAGCNKEQTATEQQQEDKLTIYTTIYPLQYFTERIGGDYVNTENVVPPGADAHSVEITTKTMMKIANSSAFIHTGTGLESFAESVEEALKREDVLIVNATENVDLIASEGTHSHGPDEHKEESHSDEAHGEHSEENHSEEAHDEHSEENHSDDAHDEHGEENHSDDAHNEHSEENHSDDAHEDHSSDKDPHIWLDPNRSIKLAENIKNALIELKPEQKEEFENNFSMLKNELIELDTEFKTMVAQSKTKTFIVSHSAYGYWESVYGLEQIGISGLSPTDEPSQKQLTEIIELVKEKKLNYIFFEPNLQNKVAEVVKNETNTEPLTLNNLESITDENIKNKEDYFDIMKENLKALKIALNE